MRLSALTNSHVGFYKRAHVSRSLDDLDVLTIPLQEPVLNQTVS